MVSSRNGGDAVTVGWPETYGGLVVAAVAIGGFRVVVA